MSSSEQDTYKAEGSTKEPLTNKSRKLSHIIISDEEVTWADAWKSTLMMEIYSFLPIPPMILYIGCVGLLLEYYGDAEYFAYKGQGANQTNTHLEPPGYNFTWEESVRKFEYKKEFWDDDLQTRFQIGYFLGSVPGASISFAILPLLCFGWNVIKQNVQNLKKELAGCFALMIVYFSIMTFVLTPKAFETEDGAKTSESINKAGQLLVLGCALFICAKMCPAEYTSKVRWCVDCIIPNLVVAVVALIIFPRTINPWFADAERTDLERSIVALVGPKLVFFFVLHIGRSGARNITNKLGDSAFGSGAMYVVCFVSTFWGRVFLTGLADGTEASGTSFEARSTMILTCIAFELLDFVIRYTTNMRDQASDWAWKKIRGKNASAATVAPADESENTKSKINRVKSSKIVGNHAKKLYGEIQVLEVYFEVMAVTLFPIITMALEVHYLGVPVGDSIKSNLINALIQKIVQIPFTVPIFKSKNISSASIHAFSMRLVYFTLPLLPGFIVLMRYMAFCIVENLSIAR